MALGLLVHGILGCAPEPGEMPSPTLACWRSRTHRPRTGEPAICENAAVTAAHPGSRTSSFGVLLGLRIGVLIGGAITYLGVVETEAELRLRGGGDIVEADVVDTRVMTARGSGTTYEVRYAFTLPGAAETYSLSDATGREGLWTALPRGDWDTARASRKVAVRYLPEDPWVSRPVNSGAAPLGDPIAGIVLGLLIWVPSLILFVRVLRSRS
ncbi:DUF3592 domain-containing protein [Nannocystis sp. ILAH1]|uniref:DUF3592 domain-containing protein n=1 Tax=Nannocystis sp. ILAH1 TaxID=2996789 RepID=UPI00226DE0A4|nr:DUF3592 domain-containing protein [Nannocystis sp. ILAH1]MCY0994945.1 DUF3592 domain-containing protein [Nannocystis sp. ILAH1]